MNTLEVGEVDGDHMRRVEVDDRLGRQRRARGCKGGQSRRLLPRSLLVQSAVIGYSVACILTGTKASA